MSVRYQTQEEVGEKRRTITEANHQNVNTMNRYGEKTHIKEVGRVKRGEERGEEEGRLTDDEQLAPKEEVMFVFRQF